MNGGFVGTQTESLTRDASIKKLNTPHHNSALFLLLQVTHCCSNLFIHMRIQIDAYNNINETLLTSNLLEIHHENVLTLTQPIHQNIRIKPLKIP